MNKASISICKIMIFYGLPNIKNSILIKKLEKSLQKILPERIF